MPIYNLCDIAYNKPTLFAINWIKEPVPCPGGTEIEGWYLGERCKIRIPSKIWDCLVLRYANTWGDRCNFKYVYLHTKTEVYKENVSRDVYFDSLMVISFLTEAEFFTKRKELEGDDSVVNFNQEKFWNILRYILRERRGDYSDSDRLLSVDDIKFFVKESII